MYSPATQNEFLRLRVQGLSLATIGRRLGVSKPTIIKWNRQRQSEIASQAATDRQRVQDQAVSTAADETAALTRKYDALKQELLSRSLRDVPTSHLEQLAGEFRQRLDALKSALPPRWNPPVQQTSEPNRTITRHHQHSTRQSNNPGIHQSTNPLIH